MVVRSAVTERGNPPERLIIEHLDGMYLLRVEVHQDCAELIHHEKQRLFVEIVLVVGLRVITQVDLSGLLSAAEIFTLGRLITLGHCLQEP